MLLGLPAVMMTVVLAKAIGTEAVAVGRPGGAIAAGQPTACGVLKGL